MILTNATVGPKSFLKSLKLNFLIWSKMSLSKEFWRSLGQTPPICARQLWFLCSKASCVVLVKASHVTVAGEGDKAAGRMAAKALSEGLMKGATVQLHCCLGIDEPPAASG